MAGLWGRDTPRSIATARGVLHPVSEVHASYDGLTGAPLEALLQIVAKGNALVAELLQISNEFPRDLKPKSGSKYAPLLFDFKYLKDPEAAERKIEGNRDLIALDDEFREANGAILELLYQLYEDIVVYHASLTEFLQQLQDGAYLQCTLETLLLGSEGKQLVMEAMWLLGALLLMLDRRIGGAAREASIVAHYRIRGGAQALGPLFSAVIALAAATPFQGRAKRLPTGYPESYLARLPLPAEAVLAVVSCIRSEDVYNQIPHFPSPDHRTTAIAHQASQLYVLLFYVPHVLHKDNALMRVLVDKHFNDHWVVSWAPGFTADLAHEWENYRAAKAALGSVITPTVARELTTQHAAALPELRTRLAGFLSEGLMGEEALLAQTGAVFNALRAAAVTLRWLILHATAVQRRLREPMAAALPTPGAVVALLLDTAYLETEVKRVYGALLGSKERKWEEGRRAALAALRDLVAFHSGASPLPAAPAEPSLAAWFAHLADQVEAMRFGDPVGADRRTRQLIAALEDLEQQHQVEGSEHVRQAAGAVRRHLAHMVRIAALRDDLMATLVVLADFSYAWGLIDAYVPALQAQVRREPGAVLKLRCLFLKLRSLLEMPLLRLSQAALPDLHAVTAFYSHTLLALVRRVLQVIPTAVFEMLDRVVALQSGRLGQLPARLEKEELRGYAQVDARAQLAHYTHRIAAFAQGILALERTFMGVIEVDPRRLLEDGIRAQLARRIAGACGTTMTFQNAPPPLTLAPLLPGGRLSLPSVLRAAGAQFVPASTTRQELDGKLHELGERLRSFQRCLEYVQDFVGLDGVSIWQEELERVIAANVEREVSAFDPGPPETSGAGPCAQLQAAGAAACWQGLPLTFIGRLTGEILRLSDPSRTQYQPLLSGWYDPASGEKLLGLHTFRELRGCLGAAGLAGMDRLLAHRIAQALQRLDQHYRAEMAEPGSSAAAAVREFMAAAIKWGPAAPDGPGTHAEMLKRTARLWGPMADLLAVIGQAQLLRQRIAMELSNSCRLDANWSLSSVLTALDEAMADDIIAAHAPAASAPEASRSSSGDGGSAAAAASSGLGPGGEPGAGPPAGVPRELVAMLDLAGRSQPGERIYVKTEERFPELPALLMLFLISILPRYEYSPQLGLLQRAAGGRRGTLDCQLLLAGLRVLLRQYHAAYLQQLLQYMGQYMRMYLQTATSATAQGVQAAGIDVTLPTEVGLLAAMVEQMAAMGRIPYHIIHRHLPAFLIDTWVSALYTPVDEGS